MDDRLSPSELDELQRLAAPGSLRTYLTSLRDFRARIQCGDVWVGGPISFGIAKEAEVEITIKAGRAVPAKRTA